MADGLSDAFWCAVEAQMAARKARGCAGQGTAARADDAAGGAAGGGADLATRAVKVVLLQAKAAAPGGRMRNTTLLACCRGVCRAWRAAADACAPLSEELEGRCTACETFARDLAGTHEFVQKGLKSLPWSERMGMKELRREEVPATQRVYTSLLVRCSAPCGCSEVLCPEHGDYRQAVWGDYEHYIEEDIFEDAMAERTETKCASEGCTRRYCSKHEDQCVGHCRNCRALEEWRIEASSLNGHPYTDHYCHVHRQAELRECRSRDRFGFTCGKVLCRKCLPVLEDNPDSERAMPDYQRYCSGEGGHYCESEPPW